MIPAALPAVRDGRATPQDQGSQAVVAVLDPQPGERVADLAAAPGGKATAIAERVGADGLVVALDVDAGRVRLIDGAAHRLGLAAPCTPRRRPTAARCRCAPARSTACCSTRRAAGSACCAAAPTPAGASSPSAIGELAALQRELLAAAAPLVRPGGVLVYSVCTLTRRRPSTSTSGPPTHLPELRRARASGRAVDAARPRRAPAPAGGRHRRHVRPRRSDARRRIAVEP